MKSMLGFTNSLFRFVIVWIVLSAISISAHNYEFSVLTNPVISETTIELSNSSPGNVYPQTVNDYQMNTDTISLIKFKSEYRLRLHDASYTDTLQLEYTGEPVNQISFKLRKNPPDLGGNSVLFFSGLEKGSDISGPEWNLSYELVLSDSFPFGTTYYEIQLTALDSAVLQAGTYTDFIRFSYDVALILSVYNGQCHPDTHKTYFRIEDIQSSLAGGGSAGITAGEYQITDVIPFYSAQLIIPFRIFSNYPESQTIYLGLDPQATDSIDWLLGESFTGFSGFFNAGWIPPINDFNTGITIYRDYRNLNSIPFSDTLEHRVKYQVTANTDTVYIGWNFPNGISGRLQDLVTGNILNVLMSDSGVISITDFETLNPLKLLVYYYGILPVELMNFSASVLGSKVLLNWVTTTETNNMGFNIERRKLNAINDWTTIGFVSGFGTTTEPISYSFIDDEIPAGTYLYRLKQFDYDGTFKYSDIIKVEFNLIPSEYVLYQNYPNPFNPATTISYSLPYDSEVLVSIHNVLGEEIQILEAGNKSAGYHEVNWNASGVASGIYFYKLKAQALDGNNEILMVKKMVLLR